MQWIQNATTNFIFQKYTTEHDFLSLGCLPVVERVKFNLAKMAHIAIYFETRPKYLNVERTKESNNNIEESINYKSENTGTFEI